MHSRRNGAYKKPVITAIKLDPQQAVIATCQNNGNYMAGTNACIGTFGGAATWANCATGVKGATVAGVTNWESGQAPS